MNWQSFLKNWKTTASAILTATLVTSVALLTYPPIQAHPQWVIWLGGVQIVVKVWIGLIQKDAKDPQAQQIMALGGAVNNAAPVPTTEK